MDRGHLHVMVRRHDGRESDPLAGMPEVRSHVILFWLVGFVFLFCFGGEVDTGSLYVALTVVELAL